VAVTRKKKEKEKDLPRDEESLPSGDDQPQFDEPGGEDADETEAAGARPT
jgi:hypothetical protein